jgi:hypothetical protein
MSLVYSMFIPRTPQDPDGPAGGFWRFATGRGMQCLQHFHPVIIRSQKPSPLQTGIT